MSTTLSAGRSSWFLSLLGVPLLIIGCGLGFVVTRAVARHLSARGWAETTATIQHVYLDSHHSRKGRTSYRVGCAYTYHFGGRDYAGYRVGFSESSDNIGSWHRTTYQRLNDAHERGQTVPCFVNPADPTQALLDRDLRFWLLFVMLLAPALFGGMGAVMTVSGVGTILENRRRQRLAEAADAPDDQPWLADPRWAAGEIRSSSVFKAAWAIGAAAFWNVVWSPLLFFLPGQVAKGDYLALLTLICPLIGLALIVWAARTVIQNRKFGRSYFRCQPLPGVIGGHLRGTLVLSGEIATLDEVQLTLHCQNTITTHGSRNNSTQTKTLWEAKQTLQPEAARFGESKMELPVNFAVPESCRPTDDSNSDDVVNWQLVVQAPAVGVDLSLTFEVPVFRIDTQPARFRSR